MEQEISTADFLAVVDVVQTNINTQFELWITITFAVIIASFVAGHKLPRPLKHLIAALYLSVSTLLMLVLIGSVRVGGEFGNIGAFGDTDAITTAIAILRALVWLLGSFATIVFIYKGFKDTPPEATGRSPEA